MALATRPKPNTQHKKRSAQHHKKSKHYLKAYWPYIPMLLIVGLGVGINSLWSNRSQVLGTTSDYSAVALLAATNQDRSAAHEAPLSIDPQLVSAAQAKANDMAARNYWSHNTPDGRTPWSFITAAGYNYQVAGENLAYGFADASQTVTGWMNSAEHRANILDSAYQNVGFGVARSANYQGQGPQTIVVAEYGQPVAAAANITFNVSNPSGATAVAPAKLEPATQFVSRIQLLTGGNAVWSLVAVSALAGGAFALFIVRHGLRLRRLVLEGEAYVAHHPYLDIAMVFIVTAGVVLTRTGGIIR